MDIVKMLLERGADHNATNNMGEMENGMGGFSQGQSVSVYIPRWSSMHPVYAKVVRIPKLSCRKVNGITEH